jgi:hypothetical protein
MQTRSRERTGAGGSFELGAPKAEIRNAAATTSRCVGSDKVARRSCDRPAMIATPLLLLGRCGAKTLLSQLSEEIPSSYNRPLPFIAAARNATSHSARA